MTFEMANNLFIQYPVNNIGYVLLEDEKISAQSPDVFLPQIAEKMIAYIMEHDLGYRLNVIVCCSESESYLLFNNYEGLSIGGPSEFGEIMGMFQEEGMDAFEMEDFCFLYRNEDGNIATWMRRREKMEMNEGLAQLLMQIYLDFLPAAQSGQGVDYFLFQRSFPEYYSCFGTTRREIIRNINTTCDIIEAFSEQCQNLDWFYDKLWECGICISW